MLKTVEALLPGELDGITDNRHSDISTYRLKWPRGGFSENLCAHKLIYDPYYITPLLQIFNSVSTMYVTCDL